MTYEIIDNFLPKSSFKIIKNLISEADFPWGYLEKKTDASNVSTKKYCIFEHVVYSQNVPISPIFDELSVIFDKLDCRSLLNMSCNLFIGSDNFIDTKINPIYPFPNTGVIYYLNNTDGYTIFENDVKIENIENRLVLFDATKEYYNSNCTNMPRKLTISFNYI